MRAILMVTLASALVAGAAPAAAQGNTPITAAKRAATGAATKANARNAAGSGNPGGVVSAPAATPATPAATPAATKATPAASKAAAKPEPQPAKPVRPDSQARTTVPATTAGSSTSVAQRGAAGEMTFAREVYAYPGRGRRDPFVSLLQSGDLRPLLSDLKLVTVLYDPTGRNSVAILRDLSTKDQYRVKLGQQLGRMRVAQIQPKQLVFTIEEFGYSRQETLGLTSDTTTTRTR